MTKKEMVEELLASHLWEGTTDIWYLMSQPKWFLQDRIDELHELEEDEYWQEYDWRQ